jgi:hypothetical protein
MKISYESIREMLEIDSGNVVSDWCSEYGEPGYSTPIGAETPLVMLGNWWCQCGKVLRPDGTPDLHGHDYHHPRLWAQLEAQGVECVWYDEWVVDYENDKCYRVSGDSYGWQPVTRYTEGGDLITPDDDIETWIEDIQNGQGVLPSRVWSSGDLIEAGFTLWEDRLESGLHPGMDADPAVVTAAIREVHGDSVDIVFALTENSQFYSVFAAYVRPVKEDDD